MPVDRNDYVRCAQCKRIYVIATTAQPGDRLSMLKCTSNCNSTKFYGDDGSGVPLGETAPVLVVPVGWEPEQELYECSACHGVFAKTWSDDVAEAEYAIEFSGSTEPKVIVCDDCFKRMMQAFRPTAFHTH